MIIDFFRRRSATVSPILNPPVENVGTISPLVPLVGSVVLLVVIGTAAIFLPPYLLALETHKGKSIISTENH
jgi:hypothetical protein